MLNNNQREFLIYHYKVYLTNRYNNDPVGGFEDMSDLFKDLADSDPKLKEMMDEMYEQLDNDG